MVGVGDGTSVEVGAGSGVSVGMSVGRAVGVGVFAGLQALSSRAAPIMQAARSQRVLKFLAIFSSHKGMEGLFDGMQMIPLVIVCKPTFAR